MACNPAQYLKFADDRRRPAIDLLARIAIATPRTIVDLGCGAGNVTRLLAERWPDARITGVDNSPAMLASARKATSDDRRFVWIEADVGSWVPPAAELPDLIFSNAALHWLDDHQTLLPKLLNALADRGALAVQVPDNFGSPAHVTLFDVARSARFRNRLASRVRASPVAPPDVYYEWLAPHASRLDVWTTEYLHALAPANDGEHPVVAWMSSTAMTPFTSVLDADETRAFVDEFRARVAPLYPARADGRVLFPFRRRFIVAQRGNR
jgi:trans-aconitate 2-methyltransferase